MEEYKYVKRNIKFEGREPSSSYKCTYNDKNTFNILQITCLYGSECRIYEVESKYLTESKSIHFKAERNGDSFSIEWIPQTVAPHIKQIK